MGKKEPGEKSDWESITLQNHKTENQKPLVQNITPNPMK